MLLLLTILGSTVALENGLARTPPMGWMSWTMFKCELDCTKFPNACISQDLYQQMADRLVDDGYRDAGYSRIHVDDCWMTKNRDRNGNLVPDPVRFSDGIDGLAKYMHDRGLGFAIYEDAGNETCMGYPGSMGYEQQDANTFAKWGCDYLKFDGCWYDTFHMHIVYPIMGKALLNAPRPMVYSCSWPAYLMNYEDSINYKAIADTCNLWRNYYDIDNSWGSILGIIKWYNKQQDKLAVHHGPGHWNDPDMIVAGNPGVTFEQAKSQFTIWAMWSAPLILSNDLRTLNSQFKALLLNKDVIAVDQDPLGIMGKMILETGGNDVWVYTKPMTPVLGADHSFAVAALNVNNNLPHTVPLRLTKLGLNAVKGYRVKNLYTQEDLGVLKPDDLLTFSNIPPNGSVMFKATLQH